MIADRTPAQQFEDVFNTMLFGDKLGTGMSRNVYSLRFNEDLVAKIEYTEGWFQNVLEDHLWSRVKEVQRIAVWFAPVVFISSTGGTLIMKRTSPPPLDFEWPEKVPAFFTDLKKQNWGLMNGRLVCHDYGTHLMMEKGMTTKMVKADWWDGSQ